MKFLILFVLTLLSSSLTLAGGEDDSFGTRNGGSYTASQFLDEANALLAALTPRSPLQIQAQTIDIDKMMSMLAKTRIVISEKQLLLNGSAVDAINYPQANRIDLYGPRWSMMNSQQRHRLILHELLGLCGYQDPQYKTSQQLFEIVGIGNNWDRGYRPACKENRLLTPAQSLEMVTILKSFTKSSTTNFSITLNEFECIYGYDIANLPVNRCILKPEPSYQQSADLINVLQKLKVASYTQFGVLTETFEIFGLHCQTDAARGGASCTLHAYWNQGCAKHMDL